MLQQHEVRSNFSQHSGLKFAFLLKLLYLCSQNNQLFTRASRITVAPDTYRVKNMRRITLLLCFLLSTTVWTFAYDFQSGDLYYNIISDSTVEVTSDRYYSGLTSVIIPESVTYNDTTYSVTSIGESAFYHCRSLTSITIPNSVTTIEYNAFRYCTGLTSVTIPNSVTTIGGWAFSSCTGLTSITIPNSVTTIGEYAFSNVSNIVYSGTATGSPWGARSVNGYVDGYLVYSDATKTTLLACSGAATGTITIPNSVTTIGIQAFYYCTGLTSITIPNSVTSIGARAFYGCTGLTSITIPNSIMTIEESAFSGCTGLTSITIPNSVTTIEGNAFSGCTGLTSITIPNSVMTIEGNAFYGCSGLTSVTIPNSVTTIGTGAFYGCTNLTSIVIGNSVTSIGSRAFWRCKGLASVTCYAVEPPTIKKGAFPKEMESISLYVPKESVEKYKATEVWKDFMEILPIQNTAIDQPILEPIYNSKQSRKVLRNGQVLILRNGTTYDVIGHQVL